MKSIRRGALPAAAAGVPLSGFDTGVTVFVLLFPFGSSGFLCTTSGFLPVIFDHLAATISPPRMKMPPNTARTIIFVLLSPVWYFRGLAVVLEIVGNPSDEDSETDESVMLNSLFTGAGTGIGAAGA